MKRLIDKLHQEQMLTAEEFHRLLANRSEETDQYARELANQVRQEVYGNTTGIRYLPEGSLNLPITVKMTAIIVESVGAIRMHSVTD